MNLVTQKYAAALLPFAVVILTAFQASADDGIDRVEALQLAAIVAANIVVFLVPLLPNGWHGAFKVGAAVIGALVTAWIPIVNNAWDGGTITVLVLAALNALAVQLGVSIRLSAVAGAIADTAVPNAAIEATDPGGAVAVGGKHAAA